MQTQLASPVNTHCSYMYPSNYHNCNLSNACQRYVLLSPIYTRLTHCISLKITNKTFQLSPDNVVEVQLLSFESFADSVMENPLEILQVRENGMLIVISVFYCVKLVKINLFRIIWNIILRHIRDK